MAGNKKAAAPFSSVGADGEQPLSKNNEIIADLSVRGNLQAANPDKSETDQRQTTADVIEELKTISMTELYDMVYPPRMPVAEGLFYAGTYLFVGAPKVGKSFFMAQLGYHVSMGISLWDYPVNQGTVLYLSLEDDYGRL